MRQGGQVSSASPNAPSKLVATSSYSLQARIDKSSSAPSSVVLSHYERASEQDFPQKRHLLMALQAQRYWAHSNHAVIARLKSKRQANLFIEGVPAPSTRERLY